MLAPATGFPKAKWASQNSTNSKNYLNVYPQTIWMSIHIIIETASEGLVFSTENSFLFRFALTILKKFEGSWCASTAPGQPPKVHLLWAILGEVKKHFDLGDPVAKWISLKDRRNNFRFTYLIASILKRTWVFKNFYVSLLTILLW